MLRKKKISIVFFKSLPNYKILEQFKLKGFADNKINAIKIEIWYGEG